MTHVCLYRDIISCIYTDDYSTYSAIFHKSLFQLWKNYLIYLLMYQKLGGTQSLKANKNNGWNLPD
jgi:hypothetical protein